MDRRGVISASRTLSEGQEGGGAQLMYMCLFLFFFGVCHCSMVYPRQQAVSLTDWFLMMHHVHVLLTALKPQTLVCCRFVEAMRAAVRHTSKGMGAYISSKMGSGPPAAPSQQQQQGQASPFGGPLSAAAAAGGPQRPFPYVVPIVAKSGQLLFEETGRASKVSVGLLFTAGRLWLVLTLGHLSHPQLQSASYMPGAELLAVSIIFTTQALIWIECCCSVADSMARWPLHLHLLLLTLQGISGLREVQALCASVFTFGPNIY